MDESLVPEWMKKLRQEHDLADARRDAARKRQVEDSQTLRREGPEFWGQLQQSLAVAVDSLPVLKLSGSISRFKEGIRIEVAYQHLVPVQTYTDIVYHPESAIVHCTTVNGGICQLYLCVTGDGEIAALSELEGSPMNPEQAAEYIIHPMVDHVFIR